MVIQWFPGHMAKARREVQEKLKLVDIIFELLDARVPMSSRNPMIDEIVGHKPRIILLNKADMADSHQTTKWKNYFEAQGLPTLIIEAKTGKGIKEITKIAQQVLADKLERLANKGIKQKTIRAMIIGIPNVGKSTLINRLIGKNVAQAANKPGVTKKQAWLKLGNEFQLLDTPGILWPKFEDQTIGKKLSLTGAIKDEIVHLDEVAIFGMKYLLTHYPQAMSSYYHATFDVEDDPVLWYDIIGKQRGLSRHGDVDYEQVTHLFIRDIRQQKLGNFTFDKIEDDSHDEN